MLSKLKWRFFHTSILSLLLFLLVGITPTQASTVDSLISELHQANTDSAKYDLLVDIAIASERINAETSYTYYLKAAELTQKNKWHKKSGNVYFNMGMFTHYTLWDDTCFTFLDQASLYYNKANYSSGVLNCLFTKGTYWMNFEKLDSTIKYLTIAADYGKSIDDTLFLHKIYNNLGLAYQYTGKLDEAIEYTLLTVQEKEKYAPANLFSGYINLGLNYLNTNNNTEALKYFKLGYQDSKKQGAFLGMGLSLKNIGEAFAADSIYDSTLHYYQQAKKVFLHINDSNHVSRYYMSTSEILVALGKEKEAQDSLEMALTYFPTNGSQRLKIHLLNTQCNYMLTNNPTYPELLKIEKMALEAYDLTQETGLIKEEARVSKFLFHAYSLLHKNELAVKYGTTYMTISDSLFNEQQQEALAEQRTKFETEKKEIEIAYLNKENDLKSSKLTQGNQLQKKQKTIIWLLVGGFMITLLFVVVIYKLYQKQQATNLELARKNHLIGQQKEEKEILLKEIHHRVKNNLQIIWSLLDLQSHSIDDPKVRLAIADGKNRINSMSMIHQMLYQNEDAGNIEFKEYIHQLILQIRSTFSEASSTEIDLHIPIRIQFDMDTSIPVSYTHLTLPTIYSV